MKGMTVGWGGMIGEIKKCLDSEQMPESGKDCEFCDYFNARLGYEGK